MGASRDSAKIREEFMMMKQDMKMDTPVRCGRCQESKNPNHFLGGRYAQCVQCRGLSKGLLCTSEHVTAASTPRAITVHNLALAKEAAIRLYVSTRRNSGPAANTRNAMGIVPEFSYEPLLPGHLEMSTWLPYRRTSSVPSASVAERREMWQSPALVFPFFRYNKERSLIGRWNDLY
eukprot:jgi/Mesvir1/10429/Mv12061-RA.1